MMFAKYFEYYIIILSGPFFRGRAVYNNSVQRMRNEVDNCFNDCFSDCCIVLQVQVVASQARLGPHLKL